MTGSLRIDWMMAENANTNVRLIHVNLRNPVILSESSQRPPISVAAHFVANRVFGDTIPKLLEGLELRRAK
jgi:hypothetical protein